MWGQAHRARAAVTVTDKTNEGPRPVASLRVARAFVVSGLAALALVGCAQQPEPEPTAYAWGTVVNQDAYAALMVEVLGDHNDADELMYIVCSAQQSPQQLIDRAPRAATMTRLAVLAGCPERKDWRS